MPSFNVKLINDKSFIKALERNPKKVKGEVSDFIQRAKSIYQRGIRNNPWEIGRGGGGVPVDTGNLRDFGHKYKTNPWEATITVDTNNYKYAEYVHEGTSKMEERPWLEYVFDNNDREVRKQEKRMLNNIVNDLAR